MRVAYLLLGVVLMGCGDDSSTASDGSSSNTGAGGAGATGGQGQGGAGAMSAGGSGGEGGAGASGGVGAGGGFGGSSMLGSLNFVENAQAEHDYGRQMSIPAGFGDGEFTMELWIRPDDSYPVGPTDGGSDQLINWSDADNDPDIDGGSWWYDGNFLLDGHNNVGGFGEGTFSLQFYGGGRIRWHFGDGANAVPGGHWSIGVRPATDTPSLLDGNWHQVTLVRRWAGATDADLELWVDGALVDSVQSFLRTDMRFWFDGWPTFSAEQAGWFWGAEKQAAVGILSQYEDYKGLVAEVRYWSIAKTEEEIEQGLLSTLSGQEPGLVGYYPLSEGDGTTACDVVTPAECIELFDMKPGHWSSEGPPIGP